ncbi:MAG TPA: hypothetical protein VFP86_08835 [bacterium]|nr:hypothetical protein [bacterium]
MLQFINFVLAWVWMILIGILLITPGGVICIACGVAPNAPGYIGRPAVTLVAIVSIVLGILGWATITKSLSAGRQ